MIIECPACSKKFNIDEKLIPDEGRLLKCGNCDHTWFYKKEDNLKLELLEDLEDGKITFYKQGNFTDLCKGPHLPDTSKIKAIKILYKNCLHLTKITFCHPPPPS